MLRRLGPFDLSLIAFGAIVGSGIFRNPAVVAGAARTPASILIAWSAGGIVALLGALVFAELIARRPESGGLYAILRDTYHPVVAFMFGWTLLLVSESGGMAAAGLTFASYVEPLFGWHVPQALVGATAIALVTSINLLGVRQGGTWQNVLVIAKLGAIVALIVAGLAAHPATTAYATPPPFDSGTAALGAFFVALIPVMFAYNGFHVPSFLVGETKNPQRTLPLGLLIGVCAVAVVYVFVNVACLHVLGPVGLAASKAPASDVAMAAIGSFGAKLIALAVALSTLGFISTKALAAPRVYHQMASDRTFFSFLAWIHPKTHVPVFAIALQGVASVIMALTNSFEVIVVWVVAIDYGFIALAGIALFIARRRNPNALPSFAMPLHPYSTALFVLAVAAICVAAFVRYPQQTLYGALLTGAGAVVYTIWRGALQRRESAR